MSRSADTSQEQLVALLLDQGLSRVPVVDDNGQPIGVVGKTDLVIALKVLTSQVARCGVGVTPKILTKCSADKFCALAGGELCVYGPRELVQMTQLSPRSAALERGRVRRARARASARQAPLILCLLPRACWRARSSRGDMAASSGGAGKDGLVP